MKRALKLVFDVVEIHFSAFLIFVLFLSMFIQVIMRYGFNNPSPALYEITKWSFVWTAWISATLAWRYREHIRFNILYEKFPRKVQLALDIAFDSLFSVALGISLVPVINQTMWYKIIRTQVLGIPWDYVLMVLPIFMVLILVHNAIWIYYEIYELIKGKKHEVEAKPWL